MENLLMTDLKLLMEGALSPDNFRDAWPLSRVHKNAQYFAGWGREILQTGEDELTTVFCSALLYFRHDLKTYIDGAFITQLAYEVRALAPDFEWSPKIELLSFLGSIDTPLVRDLFTQVISSTKDNRTLAHCLQSLETGIIEIDYSLASAIIDVVGERGDELVLGHDSEGKEVLKEVGFFAAKALCLYDGFEVEGVPVTGLVSLYLGEDHDIFSEILLPAMLSERKFIPAGHWVIQAESSSLFLSHSSADINISRRITTELRRHGIEVWRYEQGLGVGDSLITTLEERIDELEYLGVVLTPNSVNSEWVTKEVKQALLQEINTKKLKVLPILAADCEVPGFLREKVYADIRGKRFRNGMLRLIAKLKKYEERHVGFEKISEEEVERRKKETKNDNPPESAQTEERE